MWLSQHALHTRCQTQKNLSTNSSKHFVSQKLQSFFKSAVACKQRSLQNPDISTDGLLISVRNPFNCMHLVTVTTLEDYTEMQVFEQRWLAQSYLQGLHIHPRQPRPARSTGDPTQLSSAATATRTAALESTSAGIIEQSI